MKLPNTRQLFEDIEARGWPIVRVAGRELGGSEASWVRDFPSLTPRLLRVLERRLGRSTSVGGSMGEAELRMDVIDTAAELARRGKLSSVFTSGQVYSTEVAIGRFANSATKLQLEDVRAQLYEMATKADLDDQREARYAEEDARRANHVQSDEEREEAEAGLERARQVAEEMSSTESRLGRIESLLERIAGALERR